MKKGSSLKEYLDEINAILMELKYTNVKMEDEHLIVILIISLPPLFVNFNNSLSVGKDYITIEEVKYCL